MVKASTLLLAACAPVPLQLDHPLGTETGEQAALPGVIAVANLDDDDRDGQVDFDAPPLVDDDRTPIEIRGPRGDWTVHVQGARLWLDGEPIEDEAVVRGGELVGEVEVSEPGARGTITVTAGDDTLRVAVTGAPLLVAHHLQPTRQLMWVDLGASNAAMVETLRGLAPDGLEVPAEPYDFDGWIQDEIELAWSTAPDHALQIVMDSIRDGISTDGLDPMPEDLLETPGVAVRTWGRGFPSSLDSFGNLEASPPVMVDGVAYPYGRVIYGASATETPHPDVVAMLEAQRVQAPLAIDTTWMCVAHVDDVVSFVPTATAPRGFVAIRPDPELGISLLEAMDPDTALPRYAPPWRDGFGYATVGAILADGIGALNRGTAKDGMDAAWEVLSEGLGLDPDEIVRVPAVFHPSRLCPEGYLGALVPSLVNLTVFNPPGEPARVLMADPFVRADEALGASDPFRGAVEAAMPADVQVVWIDAWFAYHLGEGEVHCGTNTLREPPGAWWVDALHLLR